MSLTLSEYAANQDYGVVAFVVGVGYPTGVHIRLGDPDDDRAERWGLAGLVGEVAREAGSQSWEWGGVGKPRDDRANSITRVTAWVDDGMWARLGGE